MTPQQLDNILTFGFIFILVMIGLPVFITMFSDFRSDYRERKKNRKEV